MQSIEQADHPDLPARPVDLRLYLRQGSPSESQIVDLIEPALVGTGLFRRHVVLRMRPLGARARLVQALDHVRARAAPGDADASAGAVAATASATRASAGAPGATEGELELERKLRLLRAWRDEGLITEEDYEVRRRALLERL